jgi:hypothetical protein
MTKEQENMKYQCVYINEREQRLNGGIFTISEKDGEYTFEQVRCPKGERRVPKFTTAEVTVFDDKSIEVIYEYKPLTFWEI